MSKLAYEAQAENGEVTKDPDGSKKSQGNKKSKKATMSLEEFNSMGTTSSVTDACAAPVPEGSDPKTRGIIDSSSTRRWFSRRGCELRMDDVFRLIENR